jgi:hypothetical protein
MRAYFLVLTPVTASASTLYDNLSVNVGGADTVAGTDPFDSFSTGDNAEILNGVTLLLNVFDPTDGGTVDVGLYGDSAGSPGSLIATLGTIDNSELGTALTDFVLPLAQNPILAADSRYWIGLTTADSSASWGWGTDNTGTNVGNEVHQDFYGLWCNSDFAACNSNVSPKPYVMQVNGVLPEPASITLLGTSLALGLACRTILRRPTLRRRGRRPGGKMPA